MPSTHDDGVARRVTIHQAVDEVTDARRYQEVHEALSDALSHLSVIALKLDDQPLTVEEAWQVVAAIAQGQLEQAMEERAT